jgi:hypothetical protein
LGTFFETPKEIEAATSSLSRDFQPNGFYGQKREAAPGPAAVDDIVSFSGILCFAIAGDGAPFCLDYRVTPEHPRVIWWDDVYWRVIAPDFDAFVELFET